MRDMKPWQKFWFLEIFFYIITLFMISSIMLGKLGLYFASFLLWFGPYLPSDSHVEHLVEPLHVTLGL